MLVVVTQASPFTLPADDQALALAYTQELAQQLAPTAQPSSSVQDPDQQQQQHTPLSPNTPVNEEEHQPRDPLAEAKEIARLNIMDKILIALGPPFGEKLPKAPTNDTLATVPTPIQINAEPCPYKYKRCSSQTYFPSCEVPRNTDPEIWPQRFNLFFNLSREFNNKVDVMAATLRLYKNDSLPLEIPKNLFINAYIYNKSLTRKRHRARLVAGTKILSDYIGWVTLPVEPMVRRWRRRRNNHGLLITVIDVDDIPWDAPRIFVTMDCTSGNNSLLPLPFEVQTEEEGQRYPALNVRLGSPDGEPGTTPSTSPAPDNTTTVENSTLMQSDEPDIYDYDYTMAVSEQSLMSTQDPLIEDYSSQDSQPEEEEEEEPQTDIPETPESHLLYHANEGRHSPGEGGRGHDINEGDPVFVGLTNHRHRHHSRPGVETQTHRSSLPLVPHPTSPYTSRADREDHVVDDAQLDSAHTPLPIPPAPTTTTTTTTHFPVLPHSLRTVDQPMTDEELISASQQLRYLEQVGVDRAALEPDRTPGNEREQRMLRRPSVDERRPMTERGEQGRKSRRERQRGIKDRRLARRFRGMHHQRRG
ncbi:hypothetical protein Pmani_017799 [Petrolisthes manimaculis]|uniref:TGF-beta propeptide domain-containing protein n=1 Tax=Petrolisthes manimaculis TaxID=1843537 RepID=A0AAE1U913_9EUCA|nr:hypothetical protein Pmani_017799 [Petrolisthes manimaculis]